MAEPKILILDKVENLYEDKGNVPNPVIGRLVSDSAGNQLKVKVGRGGHLKNKWAELDNGIGKAFRFTMGEFKGYPFVEDFEEVKNVFEIEAVKKTQDAEAQMKPRSYALAYAKDLAVAGKIKADLGILSWAELFNDWLTGGFRVEKPAQEPEIPSTPPKPIKFDYNQPKETPRLTLNMDWLSESIKKIWPEKPNIHFAQFLIETYSIDKAKSIDLMLRQLSQKQQADLSGKLTEMLEKL